MKKHYILAAVSLLTLSCTTESNIENSNIKNDYNIQGNAIYTSLILPKSQSYTDMYTSYPQTVVYSPVMITYHGNKISNMFINDFDKRVLTKYTYIGNLIIKQESYSFTEKGDNVTTVTDYIYSNNKLQTVIENTVGTGYSKVKILYTYSGNTITIKKYDITSGEMNLFETSKITMSNGDMVKKELIYNNWDPEKIYTSTFEYDNNNTPLKNVVGMDKITLNTHNLTKSINGYDFSVSNRSYKYNEDGYPIEMRDTNINGTLVGIMTYTY